MAEDSLLPTPSPPAKPNWLRAGVKAIPYIGEALDELVYGRLDEARWARLERSLQELGELMQQHGIPAEEANKEDFGRLLEDVTPTIARTTNDLKRVMLRDLLLNAVTLKAKDVQWESARLAGELLGELDFAAIEILAALKKLGAREGANLSEIRVPPDPERPSVVLEAFPERSITLSYDRFVVDQGYKQLTDAKARLVVAGAHGRDKYEHVALTSLGEFVIQWTTRDAPAVNDANTPFAAEDSE